jgi:cell division protein FtsI/penicillin-binding protein 2
MKRKGSSGEMTALDALLHRYRTVLKAPEKTVVAALVDVIKDLYGFDVEPKVFRYKPETRVVTIHASGVLKSEIMLHKREILTHLKGRLGVEKSPKDIL